MTFYILIATCFIGWIFLLLPSMAYLFSEWQSRFDMLKAVFDEKALKIYFTKFFPSTNNLEEKDLKSLFEHQFFKYHGRRHYIIPLIMLGLLSAIGMIFVCNNLFIWFGVKHYFRSIHPIALSAFLGAYMWVAYDQLRRFRRRDFTAHDVYKCSFRLLIAVPLGFSFSALFNESMGTATAFLLGTFPANTIFKYSRRYLLKKFDSNVVDEETINELGNLQSVNKEETERFQKVGIGNMLQLAYSDPVDLTIRTNFEFNYVIDCISQALLWLYLGKNSIKLRSLGLRGAQEAVILWECLENRNPKKRKMAEDNLREIAKHLDLSESSVKKTLYEIVFDPYTEFICEIWN